MEQVAAVTDRAEVVFGVDGFAKLFMGGAG